MKKLKYFLTFMLIATFIISCSEDDDSNFVNSITPPTNVSAAVTVTQDNTGLVTITPLGEGVVNFRINFGDNSEQSELLQPGENVQHIYAEGSYEIAIIATGLNGLTTVVNQTLIVSFQAPQNLVVTIENDSAISKQVNVTASADFAISYEVDFGEDGSEPMSSNIDDQVSFLYQNPGVYTITVTAFSAAIETTIYSEDFEVTEILAPITPAPTPTQSSANVISIYSDAYTSIPLSEINPDWGQTTILTEVDIDGNNTWFYSALNYTGIVTDYANPTDISGMSHVHFDYWSPNATVLGLKLVNTNVGSEDIEFADPITQGEWVSVDIPLSDYDISDFSAISQILFDTTGMSAEVYIDNLFFYQDTPTSPTESAPTPTQNSANVVSIYSDAYTSIGISELNPDWGQTTTLTEIQIDGNNTWRYDMLNYTGIVTDYANPTDLSTMTHAHFDYWTPDGSILGLKLVNTNASSEDIEFLPTVVQGEWVSVNIPLSDYDISDMSEISQLLFDTSGASATVFIDNLFFYQEIPSEPTTAAPTPTVPEANVISIYSDAYTSIGISELNPDWGQTTVLTEVQIDGNNTWRYDMLNYTGIVTDYANPTDLSTMTHVHFDYWTPDGSVLGFKLVNTNASSEDIEFVTTVVQGSWVSVEIPLSDYDISDMSEISQLLFDTTGVSSTVYIDNLYFHN